MSIYTRTGDGGETHLADGSRISKSSARVEAYGTVDEANSAVGFARAAVHEPGLGTLLCFVQQRLFNCAAGLATPHPTAESAPGVSAEDVAALESAIDSMEERTGALRGFVLESGSEAATRLHLARTIVRRAERRVVALATDEPVAPFVREFLNRLSDALFVAARFANAIDGVAEETWDSEAAPPAS